MLRKLIFSILITLTFSVVNAQHAQLHFPDVVLSNVETNFTLDGEWEESFVLINDEKIPLIKKEGKWKGKIKLSSNAIEVAHENISFDAPAVIPGWMSLLPPLIAIVLALAFKEVLSSLFLGVFIGAATIGFYTKSFMGIFSAFLAVLDHYILEALIDEGHLSVILFSLTIGSIVAVISKNGGMQGVVNRLIRFAQNRKSGMLTTYFLGLAIFFDDYANTLVVGNTMRSVTDKLRISREKLAYIVDSTAAPIAAVAFITTWIGAELTYISDGVEKITAQGGVIEESAYGIFISSLGYSFYPIFTLFFVYMLIKRGVDYGPMLKYEKETLKNGVISEAKNNSELEEFEPVDNKKVRSVNAILPIACVIIGTVVGLIYTGLEATSIELTQLGVNVSSVGTWSSMEILPGEPSSFFKKLGYLIGNADSYAALLWSSLVGLSMAIALTLSQRIMSLSQTMDTVVFGVKTMMSAIVILILAWSLAGVTEDLQTAEYLKGFFGRDFSHIWFLPALTFVLSAFIAFSTGSSWSTMALIYPLVIPLSFALADDASSYDTMSIMYNTIASVLAGSVLGDHCSPISDTTILSSLATSCDHINHVKTQMPYALTVGGVALFVGIIPAALGVSSFILIPLGILILYFVIRYFGKSVE